MPASRRKLPTLGTPTGSPGLPSSLPPSTRSLAAPAGARRSPCTPHSACARSDTAESLVEPGCPLSTCSSASGARDPSSSFARALARAKQAEELKLQQKKDLRAAAEWNQVFKSAANRRDPEKLSHFWMELKVRLAKKFGTLSAALVSLDTSGENSLSFLKFSDMLRLIYLPLDQRISRLLFEKVSGGELKLPMLELKRVLLERTLRRIKGAVMVHSEKKDRIHQHVQRFLGRLSQAGDTVYNHSVDRFQRKLTVDMCRELWKALLDRLSSAGHRDISVSRSIFERVVFEVLVGKYVQWFERAYVMCIFDRVDTSAGQKQPRGNIKLTALVCALMLLSTEPDRSLKVNLLFEAFDSDEDGCLLYEQILAMLQCICAQRHLADETYRGATDISFQDELAAQEGLRYYERLRWCLQRECKVEGDVVAQRELWEVLERQAAVLEEILPGMVRMRWVTKCPQEEEEDTSAYVVAQNVRRQSVAAPGPPGSGPSLRRQSMAVTGPPGSAQALRRQSHAVTATASGTADLSGHSSKALVDKLAALHQHGRSGAEGQKPERNGPTPGRRRVSFVTPQTSTKSITWKDDGQGLEPVSLNSLPDAAFCGSQAFAEDNPWGVREPSGNLREASAFKEAVTSGFRQSLRFFGEQRLTELAEGFNPCVDLGGENRDLAPSFQVRTPQAAPRTRQLGPPVQDLTRPSSPASDTQPQRSLSKSSSAPARGWPEANGMPPQSPAREGFAVPSIDSERWGAASTERFRLFCAVKSSFGRHVVPDRQQAPDPEPTGIGYRCSLCQSNHTLSVGCAF